MSKEYIAFISYNHNERDKKIASKLQSLLENYTIPKKYRINNVKNLGKVFRDETDLPCGNLPEHIKEAIKLSNYLVIICSPEYNKSSYCQEELNLFCKYHDKSHVLIVVSAGVPEKVIPQSLLPNIKENNKINNNEPLAANVTAPTLQKSVHKLKKYEFGRVVAGILQCSFDVVINRIKIKKRIKRTSITLITLIIITIAYLFINEFLLVHSELQVECIEQSETSETKWSNHDGAIVSNDSISLQLQIKNVPSENNRNLKISLPNEIIPDYSNLDRKPTVVIFDNNDQQHIVLDERIFDNGIDVNKYTKSRNFTCRFCLTSKYEKIENLKINTLLSSNNITIAQNELLISIDNNIKVTCGWGDNIGGREDFTLENVNLGAIRRQIIFNSISNSVIGHEKNFVGARENKENFGITNSWHAEDINVENNKSYIVRLYVDNNGGNNLNETIAKNVMTRFYLPEISETSISVHGGIKAPNAYPSEYWDGVTFLSDKKFHLEYEKGSALLENNGIGSNGGCILSDSIINEYIPIGYNALDGNIPAGYQFASYISIIVKAVFDE